MKYLSTPIEEIKSAYSIVVIGSGYGGAIAASRLSRAGQTVCVLERGKELQPGEYPATLLEAMGQLQIDTANEHIGPPTGLFDFHVYQGISVLTGCGLGGTSLINANVAIKPEDRVFEDTRWPEQLRNEFNDPNSLLRKGYALAADMLKPTPLPGHIQVNKVNGLQTSAVNNQENFYRVDINVNFDVDGENHVGVQQKPCILCGDCCSGCNYSAKNTLIMNYLPDAKTHGAQIFTEASVSFVEKKENKWLIHFNIAGSGENKFKAPSSFVEADIVILSAGTLGSTEILLRSKQNGLNVSDKAGDHFSGNGDVLGFGYNTDHVIDGVGAGVTAFNQSDAAGPCITGIIDLRNQPVLEDGMIIQDAAIPGALAAILPGALLLDDDTIGVAELQNSDKSLLESLKHKGRIAESLVRGAYHGAIKNTHTYLLMTHDGEEGKIVLKNNRADVEWTKVGKEEIFHKADEQLRKETKALSGMYIKNPVWVKQMNNELVTVHPLGGCCMGENIDTGVVNHKGQVFSKDDSSGVFENFYITDGSVIPRSLGVNPLITISAVSERCCAMIAAERGWIIDYSFSKKSIIPESTKTVGVQFTETMRGFYSTEINNNDYLAGFNKGQTINESFVFTLTIESNDVYTMIKDTAHNAHMSGTAIAPALSSKPMAVSNGVFNLFVDDPDSLNTKLMKYSMQLNSEEGKTFLFKGFKYVHHDRGLDEWPDTSTLYITLYEGADANGAILGQGILYILIADFEKQMRTIKAVNANTVIEGLKAAADFGKYFSKSLFEVYGGIFAPDTFYNPNSEPRKKRELRLSAPEYYPVTTDDGIQILLTRFKGGVKGPLMMLHPFNGNRLTYAIDTIDTNLAEYFYAHGYDVWLLDNRLSSFLPSSKGQYTCDSIAMYDYKAAIERIKAISGMPQVDVLAHCVGSITLFMAVLQGLQNVRSIVSTQIASDFYPAPQVHWKAGLHIPQLLDSLGIHSLTAYAASNENWENRLYDKFIKLYAESVSGYCTDPSCQRMTFMFGPLYEHKNLNDATHKANIEMFGIANMTTYEHLTKMIRAKKLLNAEGEDVYMPHLDRLALPITFLHGDKNQVFDMQSTLTTYNNLCSKNGSDLYKRYVIKDYGHNDCLIGKDAVVDVYPYILQQFETFYN